MPPSANSPVWTPNPKRWGWADLAAIAVWSIVIVIVFRDAALFRGALYYFDVTEINYPYRDFLAKEMRLGRFSRWLPDLYCGLPLYSESQAGYWHPLKYVLYPFMATWKAFNLDTVLSIWLAGLGTYGWLRRHVGALGSLTGAAIFGLGGFTWAHLIHTSMVNALASVPFAVWALESSWSNSRWRAVSLGAFAIAFQVFAGHLQDTILTSMVLGLYALIRASHETTWANRRHVIATATVLVLLGGVLSAVQWVPSKELLDRSPRAGGLTWDDLTYGSWHPELIPTLIVREAYGTRARDTDWLDGYYPYHEMDAYLGIVGLFLAAIGARAYRDRWVGSWLVIAAIGVMLMLGRFTFLVDFLHRVPIVGSSRIPVRFHLWVTLATSALAAVGVDRLARLGVVRLKGPCLFIGSLVLISIPIVIWAYIPVWSQASRWVKSDHQARFVWLGEELTTAAIRVGVLSLATVWIAARASKSADPKRRLMLASAFPLLIVADLALAHINDIATVDPSYWTTPPASVAALKADKSRIRIYGEGSAASGEPGYASKPVNPLPARETLAWSLPTVWGIRSTGGETPIISRRRVRFGEWQDAPRYALEGLSHVLSTTPSVDRLGPAEKVGSVYLHKNSAAVSRARLVGRPVYASNERDAIAKLKALGQKSLKRIVVEDERQPVAPDQDVTGSATIGRDDPEHVEVATDSPAASYLLLSDTFDPGWSATVDGRPEAIVPANVAFRAVLVPSGKHLVRFSYEPAGFRAGLTVTALGVVFAIFLLIYRGRPRMFTPEHGSSSWPARWPLALVLIVSAILIGSAIRPRNDWRGLAIQDRWTGSFHRFTWGAGIEAMKPAPPPLR